MSSLNFNIIYQSSDINIMNIILNYNLKYIIEYIIENYFGNIFTIDIYFYYFKNIIL